MNRDLELLKSVLAVPTHTYQEELMVQYICDWLKEKNIEFTVDEHLNVYAVKGEIPDGGMYP